MKDTKVLFIVPPSISFEDFKAAAEPGVQQTQSSISEPLGLLSIAAYAGKYVSVDFKILDLAFEMNEQWQKIKTFRWGDFLLGQFLKIDKELHPDIVGISVIFNSNIGYLSSISETAKKLWPKVLVVTGGGVPTNIPSYVFDLAPAIDAIVAGEGERPFLGLVQAKDRKEYLDKAGAWLTREKIIKGFVPTMDLIYDLDEIPFLRYDLIKFEQYQKVGRYHGKRESDSLSASFMTSRGCPYHCSFCSSWTVHGRKVRYHSPERVLADTRRLKEKYGINIILFQDDHFISHKKRALKILEGLADEELIIEFPNLLSVTHLDEEFTDALKAAGLNIISLAVESGSERVLNEIIHKPYKKLSKVKELVSMIHRKGLYVRAAFVIGFPGETKEEIFETFHFQKEAGFNWVNTQFAVPIVGSELYEICKKNNLFIYDKLGDFHAGKSNIKLSHSTPEEIEKLRYLMNLEVNFVENYDLKHEQPELALTAFQDVIQRAPNHAFAYYYASECYQKMGREDLAQDFFKRYQKIINTTKDWFEYAKHFNLPTT